MTTFDELKRVILKFGLKPSTSREMPLFSFTCVTLGYTKLLRERLGFSYEASAAFGENGRWHSLFNESHVTDETENFLKKHGDFFDKVALVPALKIFSELEEKFLRSESLSDLEKLKVIHVLYPRYMSCIGVYNCFWRYIGKEEEKKGLTKADIKKISNGRELLARFYPKVEELLKECVNNIGKREWFDGDLLRYLTHSEMSRYLAGDLSVGNMAGELSLRREKYFYFYIEKHGREETVTDKKIIGKLWAEFYTVSEDIKTVKGFSVCKGFVRGRVYNTQNSRFGTDVPADNFVLVASMTRPDDISLVRKCVAIVTDEGGILSHATIVARELGKPCIIGTKIATQVLKD